MKTYLIGVVKQGTRYRGFRLLDVDSKQIVDVTHDALYDALINNKIIIENVEIKDGLLRGKNGSFNRYPVLNTLIDDKSKDKNNEKSLLEPSVRNFEPYNRLISNIRFANVDNPYKVIMFTSSIMDELKTTVCANFAYTAAHNEKKVIIIDLDTRKPRIHKVFNFRIYYIIFIYKIIIDNIFHALYNIYI